MPLDVNELRREKKNPKKPEKKTIRFGGGLFHFFKNNFIPYFSGRFPI